MEVQNIDGKGTKSSVTRTYEGCYDNCVSMCYRETWEAGTDLYGYVRDYYDIWLAIVGGLQQHARSL